MKFPSRFHQHFSCKSILRRFYVITVCIFKFLTKENLRKSCLKNVGGIDYRTPPSTSSSPEDEEIQQTFRSSISSATTATAVEQQQQQQQQPPRRHLQQQPVEGEVGAVLAQLDNHLLL